MTRSTAALSAFLLLAACASTDVPAPIIVDLPVVVETPVRHVQPAPKVTKDQAPAAPAAEINEVVQRLDHAKELVNDRLK